ncbi:MAG: hypothetical protein EPN43_00045 [Jatrophihabitans sp.]|nr:MAG: hypothetical protein EPN43_00045 [Jatrophihabitans sp.]
MSRTGKPRITHADAERLLATGEGPAALSALLAAAASPPSAAALPGEAQVLAAFRSAHLAPVPATRSPSMWKSALTKAAAAKVAAAAAVATAATGGIALAAATGTLPFHTPQHPAAATVAEHSDAPPSASASASASVASSEADATEPARPSNVPAGTPSPSLQGLCHAFRAGAMSHGDVAENPAFRVLITAAGGKDGVAAYCTKVLGPAPTHPREHRSDLPEPSNGPDASDVTTRPDEQVGPPADRPSPAPTPSGRP